MASDLSRVYYDSNYNFYVSTGAIWFKIDNNDLQYCEDLNINDNPNNPVYIKIGNIDYNLAQEIDDLPELTTLTVGSEIYNQIKEGTYYFSNESQSGGVYL
jgi:hypothetical protein